MRRAQPAMPVPNRREASRSEQARRDNGEVPSASKKSKDFFEGMQGK